MHKNPTCANVTAITNVTCYSKLIKNGRVIVKHHENLSFKIISPLVYPNVHDVKEIVKKNHEHIILESERS